MRDFLQSLTHAIRVLRKNPGFTISALAVLTLGIGANTAIFSVVNAAAAPASVSRFAIHRHGRSCAAACRLSGFDAVLGLGRQLSYWRKQNDVFESIAVWGGRGLRIAGGDRPQLMVVTASDADLFKVLREAPEVGRVFTQEQCQPGREAVIVVSNAYARNHFGSPAAAVGQQIRTATRTYQIIGVMPPEVTVKAWFLVSTEGWIPIAWTEKDRAIRGNHNWSVVARLRPGVTVARAQSAMNVIPTGWLAITLKRTKVGAPSSLSCAIVSSVACARRFLLCSARLASFC